MFYHYWNNVTNSSPDDKKNSRYCFANSFRKEGRKFKNNVLVIVATSRYSRNLGKETFEHESDQETKNNNMVNQRSITFQRGDDNYDGLVNELKEML
ncbi:hypothetical protein POVCU2_0059790 [Plasmodium ovale curtisi]|uniref:Uncharacterized protein n=1 Tax=Plasmodium ovale curtisi TaxID=864141 RepID=A0A1A8X804_PLAOA|nr:hypothetical protein POVCU2_0059790 [Plasmodium ovale curtisi]SBS99906.1 hypothetical protein POVCU1_056000 [Plasmodium ovale curtisi]